MSSPPKIKDASPKKHERPIFMSTSSSDFGTCYQKDVDTNLRLVIRKITEKCGTTAQLIQFIRKFRVSHGVLVTPTEFRYLLLKFGLVLPQEQVDIIFTKFDNDRSGTIDVNEFGDFVMHSDFKIKGKIDKKPNDFSPLPLALSLSPTGRKQSIRPADLDQDPNLSSGSSLRLVNERFKSAMQLNQRYMELKRALKPYEAANKGFVEPAALFGSINKYCFPLSINDFRLILSLQKLDADNRVDISNFLDMYNPFSAAVYPSESKKTLYRTVSVGKFVGF